MRRDHREDPFRDLVATRDTAEDVDQNALHPRVREHALERRPHHGFLRSTADVEKIRGVPAGIAYRVERRHYQAGPIPDDADVPVELHVAETERASALLDLLVWRDLLPIAQLGLAEERVVVHVELRVTCEHAAIGLDEQRIDLD